MTDRAACPGPGILASLLDGTLPAREADAQREHLVSCASCRALAADGARMGLGERSPQSGFLRPWRLAAAAALVLGFGAVAHRLAGDAGAARVAPVRSGVFVARAGGTQGVAGVGGPVVLDAGGSATWTDGTVCSAVAPAELVLREPPGGERLRIEIVSGSVRFAVARRPGAVVVSAPCGTVRVLGTVFTVRCREGILGGGAAAGAAEVEVSEGLVRLEADGKGAEIAAGERAFSWSGAPPWRCVRSSTTPHLWVSRIAGRLDRALADRCEGEATALVALLADRREAAIDESLRRLRDPSHPSRSGWLSVLRALDPGPEPLRAAREALASDPVLLRLLPE